ncbi:mechanosensitive ion channel domain-containing protein [Limibacter armeniacum]|uniref:mechanosensitive ion channel domain-containing protein n=1 Tax=Limibacter armeniacum TaxID=466084 RepID=UPI002FE56AAF
MSTTDIQIILTALALGLSLLLRFLTRRLIGTYVERHNYSLKRQTYVRKTSDFLLFVLTITIVAIIWEVSFHGLSVYFVSFFTVIGVAFFASWSILSNITASLVLFFNYPFKIGEKIRIQDGDNSIEGEVIDINLFNVRILDERGNQVSYPNNLAVQKPIINIRLDAPEDSYDEMGHNL